MAGPRPDPRPSTRVPIWELPEGGERGPKPKHSRAEIAAAAVRLADTEGVDTVTMRRMAADLGMGTMSLYNYVPTKEHLVQLMIDEVASEYDYPSSPPRDKRSAIADLARQGRDITQRHSWLPAVMHRPSAIGPNSMRYVDYFLGLLADLPLDTGAKMEVVGLVNGFALMYGGMQAALAEERKRTGLTEQEQAAVQIRSLVQAAATGAYPNLTAAMAAESMPRDADDIFESCVMLLLDGASRVAETELTRRRDQKGQQP